jgi:hypothetical protein
MIRIGFDKTNWVHGKFFELDWDFDSRNEEIIAELRAKGLPYFVASPPAGEPILRLDDIGGGRPEQLYECPANTTHVTTWHCPGRFGVYDAGVVSPIVPMMGIGGGWIMSKSLFQMISSEGFRGLVANELRDIETVALWGKYRDQDLTLFNVDYESSLFRLRMTDEDGGLGECPTCGSPVICIGCGDFNTECGECRRFLVATGDDQKESGLYEYWCDMENVFGISGANWGGEDFIGTMVSRRVLSFFEANNVFPYIASSVPIDTTGMNAKQLQELAAI